MCPKVHTPRQEDEYMYLLWFVSGWPVLTVNWPQGGCLCYRNRTRAMTVSRVFPCGVCNSRVQVYRYICVCLHVYSDFVWYMMLIWSVHILPSHLDLSQYVTLTFYMCCILGSVSSACPPVGGVTDEGCDTESNPPYVVLYSYRSLCSVITIGIVLWDIVHTDLDSGGLLTTCCVYLS